MIIFCIKNSYHKEIRKSYKIIFLIIAFDDHISFGDEENRRILSDFAERELDCSTSEFEAVYLVGMSGKNIIPLKAFNI